MSGHMLVFNTPSVLFRCREVTGEHGGFIIGAVNIFFPILTSLTVIDCGQVNSITTPQYSSTKAIRKRALPDPNALISLPMASPCSYVLRKKKKIETPTNSVSAATVAW